tara:strand:- start:64036 stop:64581 length:546 start_codon:yes stop_codon:yes gene_type:complete
MSDDSVVVNTSKNELLELINTQYSPLPPLTFIEVEIQPPAVLPDNVAKAWGRNSSAVIVNREDELNNQAIYYNRLDLIELFGNQKVPVVPDIDTVETALTALNEHYGLDINEHDIESLVLLNDYTVDLTIAQSSYKYFPGVTINIYGNGFVTKLEKLADRYWIDINVDLPRIVNGPTDTES